MIYSKFRHYSTHRLRAIDESFLQKIEEYKHCKDHGDLAQKNFAGCLKLARQECVIFCRLCDKRVINFSHPDMKPIIDHFLGREHRQKAAEIIQDWTRAHLFRCSFPFPEFICYRGVTENDTKLTQWQCVPCQRTYNFNAMRIHVKGKAHCGEIANYLRKSPEWRGVFFLNPRQYERNTE